MPEWFGTDGIRGLAEEHPITPEMGMKLGWAVVRFCERRDNSNVVIIGRDTRGSGALLEGAIVSGIVAAGGKAYCLGEIPTPAVARLTIEKGAGAGIIISASHNPHEYNGFKVFSHQGFKLSEDEEDEIEGLIRETGDIKTDKDSGTCDGPEDAEEKYVSFLKNSIPEKTGIENLKVVLDCANGATYKVAPELFQSIGVKAEALFTAPDGININRNCGSQHTEALQRRVIDSGADLGLAFDGDGDRLIAVDENGAALTGDQLLMIYATMLKKSGELKNDVVVSTVMSNIGLSKALGSMGLSQVRTKVGDRHVMEEMKRNQANLGGEDSGHIIFLDCHTTGDGLLSALQLLRAIKVFDKPLSELSKFMAIFPQTLINVPVKRKPDILSVPPLVKEISEIEQLLGNQGRVLVRYSGTEPVCRVMVEGEDKEKIEDYAQRIAGVVRDQLS